ncbi:restriction endonuclease subunit S [Aeromonas jandaei]|uniref:restriction endonuclease subunit S n=1 Tax=Aeromonas jandaei TaxID=650 RepID=UPI003EC78DCE
MTLTAMPKYDTYKDSGVEWLGDIPHEWKLISLKRTVVGCVNGLWGKDPNSTNDIIVLRVADFERNKLKINDKKLTVRSIPLKDRCGRLLKKGDLLIEKSGGGDKTLVGCVVLFDKDYDAITSNFVAKMTPKDKFDARFLCYLFSALYSSGVNYRSIKQTTGIQNLDSDAYLSEVAAFPLWRTQVAIANFLDQKTTQIDEAIAIKEQQIALLNERKQTLIQQAVTQGLDPNVPMKDSGVAWIGTIPAHWGIKRAKYLFNEINERSINGDEELLSVSHITGVTPRSEKNVNMFMAEDYSGSKTCKKNDLVINIMWAWMGALGVSDREGIVSPSYGVFREKTQNTFNPVFLEHLLKSKSYIEHYNQVSTGLHSSRLRFYGHMFFDMEMGFPSFEEQNRIIEYIQKESKNIDKALVLQEQQITMLKEYKTTLINSAVTGKIKVV